MRFKNVAINYLKLAAQYVDCRPMNRCRACCQVEVLNLAAVAPAPIHIYLHACIHTYICTDLYMYANVVIICVYIYTYTCMSTCI